MNGSLDNTNLNEEKPFIVIYPVRLVSVCMHEFCSTFGKKFESLV